MSIQLTFEFKKKYCIGCATCQIACKDKNNLKLGEFFRKVTEYEGGSYSYGKSGEVILPDVYTYWRSDTCKHCDDPHCLGVCPSEAITKNPENGIVMIQHETCTGCRKCERACPHHAITFLSVLGKAGKCDFCRDLLAQDQDPACVSACPMRVLRVHKELR
jgi:anaerobic dimethyl sulfoxide reductase subunit B (iron-sulfur subunit)